jgi:hypothetical protein
MSALGESDHTKIALSDFSTLVRSSYTPSKRARADLGAARGSPTPSMDDESWVMDGIFEREALPQFDAVKMSALKSPSGSGKVSGINLSKAVETLERNLNSANTFLGKQQDDLATSFSDLKGKVNSLAIANGRLDGLMGRPQGFGAEYGVGSAFDAIRYLNDVISERLTREMEPFVSTPYVTMVDKLHRVASDVSLLEGQVERYNTSRITSIESSVTELRSTFERTIDSLKNRVLAPLAGVNRRLMDPWNTVFDRMDEIESNLRRLNTDANLFGGLSYSGAFDGRTKAEAGSTAQLADLGQRLSELEVRNTTLTTALDKLRLAGAERPGQGDLLEVADEGTINCMLERISQLESVEGDGVSMGVEHFKNLNDVEDFL